MIKIKITIIVPAHNEEKNIKDTILSVYSFLIKNKDITNFEIIIVEDGSDDNTLEIAKNLESKYQEITLIHSEKRLGKGKAIEKGIRKSSSENIVFLDADDSTETSCLKEMIDTLKKEEFDIVIGQRSSNSAERSLKRRILSRGYNLFARNLLRTKIKDHQCGFKGFKKSSIINLLDEIKSEGFFWDTEILYLARESGLNIKEIKVNWTEEDNSSVNPHKIVPEMAFGLYRLTGEKIFKSKFSLLHQYIKFAIIGALGGIINTIILYTFTEFLGIYYILSSLIAIETSIIAMFFLNNELTFINKKIKTSDIIAGIFKSNIIRSFGIMINLALLFILTEYLKIFYIYSNIIAIFIASIFNFIGEKRFNWKEKL